VALAVTFGAAGLGYKIVNLNSALAATRLKADSLDLRASELTANLASTSALQQHLLEDAKAEREQARQDLANLIQQYQSATLLTLQQAMGAQQTASLASARVEATAADFDRLQRSTDQFRAEVASNVRQVARQDSMTAQAVTAVTDRVFGQWTVVLDQSGPWEQVGETNLLVRAVRIDDSKRVRLEVAENSRGHPLLCGSPFVLEIGRDARRCSAPDGTGYELAVSWAIKQGLSLVPFFGKHYPDRTAIVISRVTGAVHGSPQAGRESTPPTLSRAPGENGW